MNPHHNTNSWALHVKNTGLKNITSKYTNNRLIVVVAVKTKQNEHDTITSKIYKIILIAKKYFISLNLRLDKHFFKTNCHFKKVSCIVDKWFSFIIHPNRLQHVTLAEAS